MHRLSERKRKRERDTQKSTNQQKYQIERKERYVCMNMWHATKKHHGLSPIQTYQHTRFHYIEHTSKCMKHCENANVMQCISKKDHLNVTQPKNFTKISSILKNPKNVQQPQKPSSKWMKCMINERKEIILDEEHKVWAKNQVGKVKRLSEKCLGERKECFCQENMTKVKRVIVV